ncbi:MAG: hypothetical protein ACRDRI_23310 [Pseudonocardiaceae bacterium]
MVAALAEQIDGELLAGVLDEITRAQPLVVIIDQFEELLAHDLVGAARLCDLLLPLAVARSNGAGRFRILVSLRGDYLSQTTEHLPDRLFEAPFSILPIKAPLS